MARVDHLIVENYRGATTRLRLDFDAGKRVALVFGENGTGKTTIVDALDAVGNCAKGSLEDKSSTRARDHLPTIGKRPADILITLTSGANIWNATLAGDNISTNPEPRPKIRVLRRSHLQKLIEAQPAQRYEALRHFIDVGKVERAENALRDAASGTKREFDTVVNRSVDAETQLQAVWEAEGKPGTDAIKWAQTVAAQDTAELDQEVERIRFVQSAITRAESSLTEWQQALAAVDQRAAEAKQIEEEVAQLPGVGAKQAISLVGILKQVGHHLQLGTHPDECPVCRQGIPIDRLKADIQTRLAELQQYEQLRTKRDTASRHVEVAQQAIEAKQAALLDASHKLFGLVQAGDIAIITAAGINQADYAELAKQDERDLAIAIDQATQLVGVLSGLKQVLAESETATSKRSGMINSIRVQYEQLQESILASEELERLQAALQEAYDTARLTRIEFTQDILDDIATECNRLYSFIHPGEPIAISRLALDQGRRASLNQAAMFEGHNNVPPQAYFSESHLDTLGFCFWLALAKRESPNANVVVVLDDVFTSVDAQHINRIAQLITDEAINFAQVIATTHQRLWRDIYRYQHGACRLTQMIELQRWSLSKGISNFKTRLAVDDLIASIAAAPFDRQVTASRAGILLEAVLDWLALQYRCRVARTHDGSYTLGELLDGTESLFKNLEIHRPDLDTLGQPKNPAQYVVGKVDGIMGQIRSLNFLRNQVGAHFNSAGAAISDVDIQLCADQTVKLAEALSCETCGQIPSKKTATYFQCSCTAPFEVRMQPLQL